MREIIVERRFQGPSQSANGGYIAGVLAELIDGPAEITLRSPPPLDTPMSLEPDGEGFRLSHGDTLVGSVRPGGFDLEIPPKPSDSLIDAARADYPGEKLNLLPHCFVCGVARAEGDGLRVFASPIPGASMVAARWTPHASMTGEGGKVLERYVFAALDCPGAYAFHGETGGSMLLGRITGEVTGMVRAGESCTVMAWQEGRDGRKAFAGSAVLNAAGDVVASARATWIVVENLS